MVRLVKGVSYVYLIRRHLLSKGARTVRKRIVHKAYSRERLPETCTGR